MCSLCGIHMGVLLGDWLDWLDMPEIDWSACLQITLTYLINTVSEYLLPMEHTRTSSTEDTLLLRISESEFVLWYSTLLSALLGCDLLSLSQRPFTSSAHDGNKEQRLNALFIALRRLHSLRSFVTLRPRTATTGPNLSQSVVYHTLREVLSSHQTSL